MSGSADTQGKDDQDKLVEFVTNPETIKRAAEGSMQKRQALLDRVSEEQELCNESVYWWDGEYDGACELPKGHIELFHYDGISYYDNENNNRDGEQERLEKLKQRWQLEARIDEVEHTVCKDNTFNYQEGSWEGMSKRARLDQLKSQLNNSQEKEGI